MHFDRGRQEALQGGRFAQVTKRGRSGGAAVWTHGFVSLDCRTVRMEERVGPSPKGWDTLARLGCFDRGYDALFLNAFLRVLSHFSRVPQEAKTGSSLSLSQH